MASFVESQDDTFTQRAKDSAERRPKNSILTSTGFAFLFIIVTLAIIHNITPSAMESMNASETNYCVFLYGRHIISVMWFAGKLHSVIGIIRFWQL